MIHYIRLLRPLQWLKNGFVFAPIFFSNNLLKWDLLWPTLVVFASFCLISSSIYCFNDLRDVEADRQHPKKCKRPIASGKVSVKGGYAMMVLSMVGAYMLLPFSNSVNIPYLYIILAAYWLMNIAYCIKLKQYAILDVAIIAVGFVIRVLIGGVASNIWISHWLVMMTFLIALFLAFTKRNDDYRIYEQTGIKPRVSITGYNKTFINEATAIIASVTLVCYIMYTMSEEVIARMGTRYVYLTSGWVLAGMLRYLQNMIVYGLSGSPTKSLVKDHFIQFCILGWLASFFVIIYL
ncbi:MULTISPECIES: UbiA prenyltransferase family protein [Prevotellaceae]|nr:MULTISPECIES: UbiA prenyltransferase family protein [Prevotellaceae]MCR5470704.1 UbiA prenyltransferase family protein [Prevotella sp.]